MPLVFDRVKVVGWDFILVKHSPFAASTVTPFRKRFPEDGIKRINGRIARDGVEEESRNDDGGAGGGNRGTLIVDAAVAPPGITYPQDLKLLNSAREHAEGPIGMLHAQTGGGKPRTYRRVARKDLPGWSKPKRRPAETTRKAIGRQLNYLKRDPGYIAGYLGQGADVAEARRALIGTLDAACPQQACMHGTRSRSVPGRIVSIPQPRVRPIARGKAHADTGSGAKAHAAVEDGFAHIGPSASTPSTKQAA